MCFRPKDVPSKKVVLVELERVKVALEQENSALKVKLRDLQASAARTVKERDGLSSQRSELESQLQQRATHASHLLTQVTCLSSGLASRLEELLDQHQFAVTSSEADDKANKDRAGAPTNKVNVHVVDEELCGGEARAAAISSEARALGASPAATQIERHVHEGNVQRDSPDDTADCEAEEKLSVQQQLDREVEALARSHQRAVEQVTQLHAQLRQAEGDKAALQSDVAGARRRLQQAEANAADQQDALHLRCAALEQENEQLTGMNQELQQRLNAAQGELSAAKKQWGSDGAQLAKQAAELDASKGRLLETEAELRALQSQLAAATAQAQDATTKVLDLQEQVAARASSLDAVSSTLAARETELEAATGEVRQLQVQLAQHQQAKDALSAELRETTESRKRATEALEEARAQLAATQRDLAAAQQQLETQTQALAGSNSQLLESREANAATGERLSRALEELAASESRLTEANSQYLTTKQSVISTAKQLASMAKDHSSNLAKLHAAESELASLREELVEVRAAEAVLRVQADASSAAAREARDAAEVAQAEARRLQVEYDAASADLRRKIMLLTAIARMADKGQAGASGSGRSKDGQAADSADGYGAVTSEQRLRLKICESPLPLLGALTAGIMDSSRLRHLALDIDTSREVTWEKAGLRICCLAAAIGLNNSLQTLQLVGWTWGDLGNGTALPFLALGGGGGGGVAGGMLRRLQLATHLFDLEAAAMLKDLLAAGLVELAAGGGGEEEATQRPGGDSAGQGVLHLYSGHARLDEWYRDMLLLLLADRRPHGCGTSGASGAGALAAGPGSFNRSAGPSSTGSARSSAAPLANSLSATSVATSVASSATTPDDKRGGPPGSSAALSSGGGGGGSISASSSSGGGGAVGVPGSSTAGAVDCDLSSEGLDSHHMVLVMTVLLMCPGMRRLRLDGNKLADGGAALLALGLANNTGLRELGLSRNNIRAAGARSLARCLEGSNSTLLRLDMSAQRLEGIGAAGAEAMAQALRVNRTLEDLNLSSCGITGAAAACFTGAIRAAGAARPQTPPAGGAVPPGGGGSPAGGGGSLRRLGLAGNGIDSATAKALLAAAAERPGLALSL